MAFSVQMPALGESVSEGTITRWLKQVGDTVEVDEPLLEVSTDKVDTEIPSPAAGVVQQLIASEDDTVEVGGELALIGDSGERAAPQQPAASEQPSQAPAEPAAAPQPAPEPAPEPEPAAQPRASATQGTDVHMPALGESVSEGTITRWLKQVGDTVEVDEPLLEVSTDKVDTEIPSPVAGTILELSAGEDDTVEVGAKLAVVGDQSAEPAAAPQPAPEPQPAAPPAAPEPAPEPPREEAAPQPAPSAPAAQSASAQSAPAQAAPAQQGAEGSAPYVTPLVRKLANEHGIDLHSLRGTGVGGRIRKQDVQAAITQRSAGAATGSRPDGQPAEAATAEPAASATGQEEPSAEARALRGTTQKMSRLRQVLAQRMVDSLQTAAQLTTVIEVDVTRIARLRQRAKDDFEASEGVKLSFLPFFAKATVEALKLHPKLNASIDEQANEITYHGAEHLAIAVDTDRGLLSPVIHDAGDLNLGGLARKIADVADRTRDNKVKPDELSGGTFTLTNTGSRGALFDTPILNPPQVGMLGTGTVVKRPVVVSDEAGGDTIAIRSMVYLALSYDHRLVDGADAARFLNTVKQRLEEGSFDADLGV
ncbi:2-oxoglutarate dehydrogenase E2 component [Actinopolyspora alba]|uniref:Dihydrolipoamide acetyltransferase component of pyruvate dehydrogenase complex n=1 Tax=Actinopolyspora alba TaxID=673379 RepID=A0A1I1XB77_9ACTN|nr:2-oxoglutarate dehydrogenase, E2 component, dihydrolipoamide succinyltransferase [Actinopolyspora alba]SFE04629.1 2-oxoglutarate dehydrogenase E2 component [Actinopolyspora alba]